MHSRVIRPNAILLLAIFLAILITGSTTLLATAKLKGGVIYRFPANSGPWGSLVADAAGNLYGTTANGGNAGCGTVFEMSPPTSPGGSWSEVELYSFQCATDGTHPLFGLTFDKAGNLYGTTSQGGANDGGTIFELSPPAGPGGAWTETTLYTFDENASWPTGNLIFDRAGNLYGTTFYSSLFGVVYQLSPPPTPGGAWTFTILYNFTAGTDGEEPNGGVILHNGALYGTTTFAGNYSCDELEGVGCGTVFKLIPPAIPGGVWTEQTILEFGGQDGEYPYGGLVFDAAGNLYGTASGGGIYSCGFDTGCGTVFELTPPPGGEGTWAETILYNFAGGFDGWLPMTNLTFDTHGALYGVTPVGGGSGICYAEGCGTAFRLLPPRTLGDAWTEQILHRFGAGSDGILPEAGLLRGGDAFYGTTSGTSNSVFAGTVFKFVLTE
jgi:uncharacterized repeat protein (TIGR03803 family)